MEEHSRGSLPLERLSRDIHVQSVEDTEHPQHGSNTPPDYFANEGSSSSSTHDEELPSYSQARSTGELVGRGHSARLHRSPWVAFGTVIYVAMAVYAWAIIAVLSFRPIKAKSWGYSIQHNMYDGDGQKPDFSVDEKIYRSARIIQAIVQVATLPWITAVCASAAVIYTQNQKDATTLRLRKVITLADRRWNEIPLYWSLAKGGWKKHGSAFLFLAIFIWIFGAITYPIQSLFLSTHTIKVQVEPIQRAQIFDFAEEGSAFTDSPAAGVDVLTTRADLSKADEITYNQNLWNNTSGVSFITLGAISQETFYSQVPSGFNTGLLRQFAPRLNSTATFETIESLEFPTNCNTSGSFYAAYSSTYFDVESVDYSWGVVACMLPNSTNAPWQLTHNRQDFSETLYLNFSTIDYYDISEAFYRITVNTTAGYFELPNYLNNEVPGPLLDYGPESHCDQHCMNQNYWDSYQLHFRRDEIPSNGTAFSPSTWSLLNKGYKGPLLMTALATFGPNSFFDTFTASSNKVEADMGEEWEDTCIANPPLYNLLYDSSDNQIQCIGTTDSPAGSAVGGYIRAFTKNASRIPMAFTAAAYLANQNFIKQLPGTWWVYQDLGADMEVPSISVAGMIVVSILLGFYLLPLLGLVWYAERYPRWTSRLDSFAMLRFGAYAGDKVFPLLITRKPDEVQELDEMPGVIRDISVSADDDVIKIGRLGFGEGGPLHSGRRYESFEGDDEVLTPRETRDMQARVRRRN